MLVIIQTRNWITCTFRRWVLVAYYWYLNRQSRGEQTKLRDLNFLQRCWTFFQKISSKLTNFRFSFYSFLLSGFFFFLSNVSLCGCRELTVDCGCRSGWTLLLVSRCRVSVVGCWLLIVGVACRLVTFSFVGAQLWLLPVLAMWERVG